MAEPGRVEIAWLADFESRPAAAVDELLRGVADVTPYERAGAADVLVTLFGGLPPDDGRRRAVDEAVGDWLETRRRSGPEARRRYGMNRWIEELLQALTAVHRLALLGTAARLRARFASFEGWLKDLSLGPGRDPALEVWRIMALTQADRRFLEDWYRLCRESGHTLPEPYLTVALLGLRRLPEDDGAGAEPGGRLGSEVLAGLFAWAARLPPRPAARRAFQRRLMSLKALYPRAPQRWRELVSPLLDDHAVAPFRKWLRGAGIRI